MFIGFEFVNQKPRKEIEREESDCRQWIFRSLTQKNPAHKPEIYLVREDLQIPFIFVR